MSAMTPSMPSTPTTTVMSIGRPALSDIPTLPAIQVPDSSSIASRRSRRRALLNQRSQSHLPVHIHEHHAHRNTSAFHQPRPSHPTRYQNISGTRRHPNISGTRRRANASGSYPQHLPIAPPYIHTHIRHQPRRRHNSLIRPFVRSPRTPPSSPLVSAAFPSGPWASVTSFNDGASLRSGKRERPCSSVSSGGMGANPKQSQRRTLRHTVRSLLGSIIRRQREDIIEVEEERPSTSRLTAGAPLRPHRSIGAESFHATSGRVALEPTRSSSPPVRVSHASFSSMMSVECVEDSPINPHLIPRPPTRRLPDRLVSRFSDSSDDSETNERLSVFSLGKHAKQSLHPLIRGGRKWSSATSLSRGMPKRSLSPPLPTRRGNSLDL